MHQFISVNIGDLVVMSNKTKNIKNSIIEDKILYNNIINTVYGSFYLSCVILLQKNITEQQVINLFKKAKLPYMEDKDFIKKCCTALGLEYDEVDGLPLCVVESDFNTLILPYIIDDDGTLLPMPVSKEAILPQTVLKAKVIHPIEWEEGK